MPRVHRKNALLFTNILFFQFVLLTSWFPCMYNCDWAQGFYWNLMDLKHFSVGEKMTEQNLIHYFSLFNFFWTVILQYLPLKLYFLPHWQNPLSTLPSGTLYHNYSHKQIGAKLSKRETYIVSLRKACTVQCTCTNFFFCILFIYFILEVTYNAHLQIHTHINVLAPFLKMDGQLITRFGNHHFKLVNHLNLSV